MQQDRLHVLSGRLWVMALQPCSRADACDPPWLVVRWHSRCTRKVRLSAAANIIKTGQTWALSSSKLSANSCKPPDLQAGRAMHAAAGEQRRDDKAAQHSTSDTPAFAKLKPAILLAFSLPFAICQSLRTPRDNCIPLMLSHLFVQLCMTDNPAGISIQL